MLYWLLVLVAPELIGFLLAVAVIGLAAVVKKLFIFIFMAGGNAERMVMRRIEQKKIRWRSARRW